MTEEVFGRLDQVKAQEFDSLRASVISGKGRDDRWCIDG